MIEVKTGAVESNVLMLAKLEAGERYVVKFPTLS
jgi:hypothetical protein